MDTTERLHAVASVLELPEDTSATVLAECWSDLKVRLGLPENTSTDPVLMLREKQALAQARGLPATAAWSDSFPQGGGIDIGRKRMFLDFKEMGYNIPQHQMTAHVYHDALRATQQKFGTTTLLCRRSVACRAGRRHPEHKDRPPKPRPCVAVSTVRATHDGQHTQRGSTLVRRSRLRRTSISL
jgi:hypothetical protein